MAVRRSIAVAALGAAWCAVALAAGPAGAQGGAAAASRAAARATALELTLFGRALTVGTSSASVAAAEPVARSRGVALLLAESAQGESAAESTGDGEAAGSDEPACGPLTVPPEVPLVDLSTVCSSASTSVTGGAPAAAATAELVSLAVDPMEVVELAAPLEEELQAGLIQVFSGLAPVLEATDQSGVGPGTTLQQALEAITDGGDLLQVHLGTTSAAIASDAAGVTSSASAGGAIVHVLDRSDLGLDPVLTIEVGTATAQVVADGAAPAIPEVDAAAVRITIAGDVAALLPEGVPNPIELAPGQTVDIPLPDPLASRIVAPHVATSATEDGGQRGEASAVGIDLFTGLPEGGIALEVAGVSSEASAPQPASPDTPAAAETPGAPGPDPGPGSGPQVLARTGGDGSLLVPVVLGGASLAGLTAAWRSRRLA